VTQLNAIIAVEKGVKSKADKILTDAHQRQLKAPLLSGLYRTYKPVDEENGDKLPDEQNYPQVQVVDVLEDVQKAMSRLFDVTLTKEFANTEARADVILGDLVLLSDVPVTYLLFLEKKLVDLRTFVSKLPTLDPSEVWRWDRNVGAYATDPVETIRTQKKVEPFVKWAPPSPEYTQPAQVEVVTKDVLVGKWSQRKFSGAIPADDRREMIERVDRLTEAVKMARERANTMEVQNAEAGQVVFDYLFEPLLVQAANR